MLHIDGCWVSERKSFLSAATSCAYRPWPFRIILFLVTDRFGGVLDTVAFTISSGPPAGAAPSWDRRVK